MHVTRLADFVYCEAGFPLGELPHPENPQEMVGRASHQRIRELIRALTTQRQDLGKGERLIVEQDRLLVSSEFQLEGRPDVLIRGAGSVTIIDFKTKRGAPDLPGSFGARVWDSHAAQVLAYGLAAEETFHVRPRLFVVYAARKIVSTLRALISRFPDDRPGQTLIRLAEGGGGEVVLNDANRKRLVDVVLRIRRLSAEGGAFRRNHQSLNKCYMCVHRLVCPQKKLGIPDDRFPTGEPNPGLFLGETASYPKPRWEPRTDDGW